MRFFTAAPRPVRILAIVDASGSMAGYTAKVMRAMNDFWRTLAATADPYLVTIIQFSSPFDIRVTHQAAPVGEVTFNYHGEGGTALWDAMGRGLSLESQTTDPVVCLILTDGEECSSREYTQHKVYALVQSAVWSGNWTFLWLNMQGAENPNPKALGIECLDFSRDDIVQVLTELASNLAQSVGRMRLTGERRVELAGLLGRTE
jgi:hypothetical protein